MNFIKVAPPIVTSDPPMPPGWQDSYDNTITLPIAFKAYNISPSTAEYETIANMINPLQIDEVERIVNPDLWKRFVNARKEMLRTKSVDLNILRKLDLDARELIRCELMAQNFKNDPYLIPYSDNMALLFHCTKNHKSLQNILSQGLDERLSSLNHGQLGKGIYFADDARKSAQYDGTGYIFIFAVLLGDCISVDEDRKNHKLVREPEKVLQQKRHLNDQFFDSIVARPGGYNEYVIYNRYQCCPLYKVHYLRDSTYLENRSIYNYAAQNLPPIAWISQGSQKYAMPLNKVYKQWPFYAVEIFKKMESKSEPSPTTSNATINETIPPTINTTPSTSIDEWSEQAPTTANATINDTIPPTINNTQNTSIDEKLATLINLGFTDLNKNIEILLRFNYNIDRAVNYFLDGSNVSNVVAPFNRPLPIFSQKPPPFLHNMPSTSKTLPSVPLFDMPSSSSSFKSIPSTSGSAFSMFPKNPNQAEGTIAGKEDNSATPTITSSSSASKSVLSTSGTDNDDYDDDYSEDEFQYSDVEMEEMEANEIVMKSSNVDKPPEIEECLICCSEYPVASPRLWEVLKCSHKLCSICYANIRITGTTMSGVQHTFVKCPFCQGTTGIEIGTCPDIRMDITVISKSCESYEPTHSICIHYHSTSDKYLNRYAYLPNNAEGKEVLELLKVAWDRRLCFTIGTSVTTGRENAIVWNIHHKTSVRGGVLFYGYPDPGYFERVKWELKNYGIE